MKFGVLISCLLVSVSAFATHGYKLDMELSVDGKNVSSPRLMVLEGKKGSITQESSNEKTFIEVVAKEGWVENHKGIMLNFKVGYIGADGQKTIFANPQVLAKENEPAQITVENQNHEKLSLSVIATRKSL